MVNSTSSFEAEARTQQKAEGERSRRLTAHSRNLDEEKQRKELGNEMQRTRRRHGIKRTEGRKQEAERRQTLIRTNHRVVDPLANPFDVQLPLRCGRKFHVHDEHPASRSIRRRKITIQTGELADGIIRCQDTVSLFFGRPLFGGSPFFGERDDHASLLAGLIAAYVEKDCKRRRNDYDSAVHEFGLCPGKRSRKKVPAFLIRRLRTNGRSGSTQYASRILLTSA